MVFNQFHIGLIPTESEQEQANKNKLIVATTTETEPETTTPAITELLLQTGQEQEIVELPEIEENR